MPSVLEVALGYHARGFCPIPQLPGAKKPEVCWKKYQDAQPTRDEVYLWFERWHPDAGVALVLGPAFGLLVVDVDGKAAHDALLDRLGAPPVAPTVRSGSGEPFKRHYYFRHPGVRSWATYTPWHPQLEFRGYRGIVVAPPSLHRSGGRYRWVAGRSLDDLALPELPEPIVDALASKGVARARGDVSVPPACVRQDSHVPARDVAAAEEALGFLGADFYDDYLSWLRVGMSLSPLGEDGLRLWDAWSRRSETKYDPTAVEAKWATFRAGGGLSLGSLFIWARGEGWAGPPVNGAARFEPEGFTINLPWQSPGGEE